MLKLRRRRASDEIPQASLADIAFLLLIFFIATTTFAIEEGLPLLLPSARRSAVLRLQPQDAFRIEGNVDGSIVAEGRTIEPEALTAMLRARNAERRVRGQDEVVVVVETDPRAPYVVMVTILDQVRRADCRRVALKQRGDP
jgi:biopolymer transport protein ExbD